MTKRGRPTIYNDELAKKVCVAIATEKIGLKPLHKKYPWFPDDSTIYAWTYEHKDFSSMYKEAIDHRTDMIAMDSRSEATEYDDSDYYFDALGNKRLDPAKVAAKKLVLDNDKWLAVKLLSRKYGERIETTHKIDKLEDWLDVIKDSK